MTDIAAVLLFGAVVLLLQVWIMIHRNRGWGPYSTRLFGISVVVILTTVLVMSDVAEARLTAAVALFGTVAGYLLGRSDKSGE